MTRSYLLLTLAAALWGSASASSKFAVSAMPYTVAAAVRFAAGAVILLLLVRLIDPPGKGGWERAGLAGALGVFAYNALFFWALTLAPSLDGSVIVPAMSPVITAAIAVVLLKERPSAARIAGLGVGVLGAVLFVAGAGGSGGGTRLVGDLVFLACALIWSAYTLLGQRVLADTSPLNATTYSLVAGSALLAVLAAPSVTEVAWSGLPRAFWLNLAFLVLGPTVLANLLYYRSIRQVGATTASLVMFLVPVFGAAFSAVLLGETVSPVQGVGGLAMLAGAVLAARSRLPRPRVLQEAA